MCRWQRPHARPFLSTDFQASQRPRPRASWASSDASVARPRARSSSFPTPARVSGFDVIHGCPHLPCQSCKLLLERSTHGRMGCSALVFGGIARALGGLEHNTPPPLQPRLQWSATRCVHNTPPPQYNAPTCVAWRRSIDRLPRQSNAAEPAMHLESSGSRV